MRLRMNDATQQSYAFLVSQATHFEAETYKKKYPEFQYPNLIPVDSSADPWAPSVTFFSTDQAGQAEFFNHLSTDMPLADTSREMFQQGISMAAIGYKYTLQEINQAQKFGIRLTSDKSDAARWAYNRFVEVAAISGYTIKGWTGLINDGNVTRVQVANDGTASSRAWTAKTADQIIRDVNDVLTAVWTTTNTVEMADTLLLPPAAWTILGTTRLPQTQITAWEFLMKNNAYSMATGGSPLTIRSVRELATAGADGDGRMIAYKRDPSVLKLHLPMPHQFLDPWQDSPLGFVVPGIFRLGGLEIRRPGSVRYADSITPAP